MMDMPDFKDWRVHLRNSGMKIIAKRRNTDLYKTEDFLLIPVVIVLLLYLFLHMLVIQKREERKKKKKNLKFA